MSKKKPEKESGPALWVELHDEIGRLTRRVRLPLRREGDSWLTTTEVVGEVIRAGWGKRWEYFMTEFDRDPAAVVSCTQLFTDNKHYYPPGQKILYVPDDSKVRVMEKALRRMEP